MDEIKFEIFSTSPESGHSGSYLEFEIFIELLIQEEEYFPNDLYDIKTMISRIRKIYYDKFGWDTYLIRNAANILGRYNVKIVDCGNLFNFQSKILNKVNWYVDGIKNPKCRLVSYKSDDLVFPERAGEVPEIYKNDHQDVKMKHGFFCDIGHLFAGLDAKNNLQSVSPFQFRNPITVDSNADVCTWLGDIATYCAELLYFKLNDVTVTHEMKQKTLLECASASDMHGNLDSYVMHSFIMNRMNNQIRISDLLKEYYSDYDSKKMVVEFCRLIGLGNLVESTGEFINEKQWIKYYVNQLRITSAFMVYSTTSGQNQINLPFRIWQKHFDNVLELETTIKSFINSLKEKQ
jgi:hypothetical protein